MSNIVVLGSGGWGTALAIALSKQGHNVSLWSAFKEEIETLISDTEHRKLLPGVKIPENVVLTYDDNCVTNKDIMIVAVPSFAVRSTMERVSNKVDKKTIIVNVSKGIEDNSYKRLSQVIKEYLPENAVTVLSGPSHAEEVAKDMVTSLVCAGDDSKATAFVQSEFSSQSLRIYTNDDLVGVELGGALKNVMAICKGILEGAGLGDNCIAAMMTRGLTEMARLGVKMGGKQMTFAGLTGIGDLIVTCMSAHSRNHRCGVLIGKGMKAADAIKQIGMTVEGYHATLTAKKLAQKYNVDMPIVSQCYKVMYEDKSVSDAIEQLMQRPVGGENEDIW